MSKGRTPDKEEEEEGGSISTKKEEAAVLVSFLERVPISHRWLWVVAISPFPKKNLIKLPE